MLTADSGGAVTGASNVHVPRPAGKALQFGEQRHAWTPVVIKVLGTMMRVVLVVDHTHALYARL